MKYSQDPLSPHDIDFDEIPPTFTDLNPLDINKTDKYILGLITKLVVYIEVNCLCIEEISMFNDPSNLNLHPDDVAESVKRFEDANRFNVFLIAHLAKKAQLDVANIKSALITQFKDKADSFVEIVEKNKYLNAELK